MLPQVFIRYEIITVLSFTDIFFFKHAEWNCRLPKMVLKTSGIVLFTSCFEFSLRFVTTATSQMSCILIGCWGISDLLFTGLA